MCPTHPAQVWVSPGGGDEADEVLCGGKPALARVTDFCALPVCVRVAAAFFHTCSGCLHGVQLLVPPVDVDTHVAHFKHMMFMQLEFCSRYFSDSETFRVHNTTGV